jgi:hypothetical protein
MSVMATHSTPDLDQVLNAFAWADKKLKITAQQPDFSTAQIS